MHRLVNHGLAMLGLAAIVASPTLAQEGWGDEDWWQQATLADVQERLDQGAAANARDAATRTPLHEAARSNDNPAVLALLLDRGGAVNTRTYSGETLLHMAAESNTPAVVALLLDRGGAVNARTASGNTPLHGAAASNEDPAVTALLLDRGAEVNARHQWRGAQDWTPLHRAARYNENPAVVALLLNRGADATLRTKDGQLPFDLAKENEHLRGTDVYWRLNDARF